MLPISVEYVGLDDRDVMLAVASNVRLQMAEKYEVEKLRTSLKEEII